MNTIFHVPRMGGVIILKVRQDAWRVIVQHPINPLTVTWEVIILQNYLIIIRNNVISDD